MQDMVLLREYARDQSESAFAQLVERQAGLDQIWQLGLELDPTNMPIDVLVVERAEN